MTFKTLLRRLPYSVLIYIQLFISRLVVHVQFRSSPFGMVDETTIPIFGTLKCTKIVLFIYRRYVVRVPCLLSWTKAYGNVQETCRERLSFSHYWRQRSHNMFRWAKKFCDADVNMGQFKTLVTYNRLRKTRWVGLRMNAIKWFLSTNFT
jgi:hypothetical protein